MPSYKQSVKFTNLKQITGTNSSEDITAKNEVKSD